MTKPRAGRDGILSRVEIDTLLGSIKPQNLPTLDITAPLALTPAEKSRTEATIAPILREIESILAPVLRGTVTLRIDSIDRRRASDLLAALPGPAAALFLDPAGLIHVDAELAFPMVERLLGGEFSKTSPRRELRDLEWRLLMPHFERMAASLGRIASNLFLPNEPVVVILAMAEFFDRRAAIRIALPSFRIAPADPGRIELAVRLSGDLALSDYRRLAVGDVLVTKHPAGTATAASWEGRIGSSGGRKAFQISGPADGRRGRIRRRGPARDSGNPDPSIEIRAVLSDRGVTRAEIEALAPGSIVRFPKTSGISLRIHSKTFAPAGLIRFARFRGAGL